MNYERTIILSGADHSSSLCETEGPGADHPFYECSQLFLHTISCAVRAGNTTAQPSILSE
jgi:hypothetical protein